MGSTDWSLSRWAEGIEQDSCGDHKTGFTTGIEKAFLGKLLRYLNSPSEPHELKVNVIGRA